MIFESTNGQHYRLTANPSIFTTRNNASQQLNDIILQRRSKGFSEGGAMAEDGNLYKIVAIWQQEDLAVLRKHESLPPEVTEETLHQWGLTSVQPDAPGGRFGI